MGITVTDASDICLESGREGEREREREFQKCNMYLTSYQSTIGYPAVHKYV